MIAAAIIIQESLLTDGDEQLPSSGAANGLLQLPSPETPPAQPCISGPSSKVKNQPHHHEEHLRHRLSIQSKHIPSNPRDRPPRQRPATNRFQALNPKRLVEHDTDMVAPLPHNLHPVPPRIHNRNPAIHREQQRNKSVYHHPHQHKPIHINIEPRTPNQWGRRRRRKWQHLQLQKQLKHSVLVLNIGEKPNP